MTYSVKSFISKNVFVIISLNTEEKLNITSVFNLEYIVTMRPKIFTFLQ